MKFLHALKVYGYSVQKLCSSGIYDAMQFDTSVPGCMASHFRTFKCGILCSFQVVLKCTFLTYGTATCIAKYSVEY
jgi:hypothetical protein